MARIGLCLADIAYAKRLSRLFGSEGYDVYLFRQADDFLKAVSDKALTLAILEVGIPAPNDIFVLRPVSLPEEAGVISASEKEKEQYIWRYGGSKEWLQAVRERLSLPPQRHKGILRVASIWLVYSPSGRCLKTTLAYLCAQLLAGGRSLVIGSGFAQQNEESLTDLCYGLRHGLEWRERLASAIVTEGGQAYLKTKRLTEAYATVTTEEWHQLATELRRTGFTHLVIDAGSSLRMVKQWWPLATGCLYPGWPQDTIEGLKEEEGWRELDEQSRLMKGCVLHRVDVTQVATEFRSIEDVWRCNDERLLQRLRSILEETETPKLTGVGVEAIRDHGRRRMDGDLL